MITNIRQFILTLLLLLDIIIFFNIYFLMISIHLKDKNMYTNYIIKN